MSLPRDGRSIPYTIACRDGELTRTLSKEAFPFCQPIPVAKFTLSVKESLATAVFACVRGIQRRRRDRDGGRVPLCRQRSILERRQRRVRARDLREQVEVKQRGALGWERIRCMRGLSRRLSEAEIVP